MERREVPLSSMATPQRKGRYLVGGNGALTAHTHTHTHQGPGLVSLSDHVSLVFMPVDHPHCLPLVVTFPCLCRSACLLPVFPFWRNGNSLCRMCFGQSASLYLIQGNVSSFGSQGNICLDRHDKSNSSDCLVLSCLLFLDLACARHRDMEPHKHGSIFSDGARRLSRMVLPDFQCLATSRLCAKREISMY